MVDICARGHASIAWRHPKPYRTYRPPELLGSLSDVSLTMSEKILSEPFILDQLS